MLSVKEIRNLAASLSEAQFKDQMGPFALIQRPCEGGGAGHLDITGKSHPEAMSQKVLSLLFEFEDLSVAILPPLTGMDELTVGRQPDCDLVIDDASVSKRHAVLKWNAEQHRCSVLDAGSTNGTFLNASTAVDRETSLRDGDILSFGDVQFWYLLTETLYAKLSRHGSGRLGSRSG
ncbi:MAG TPA: FHA domain-containing protein [Myxococcaceae bacterium]|nr:FHA domain-containing protein [Myxococcaceae bacterium]